jgi:hypothetical protein
MASTIFFTLSFTFKKLTRISWKIAVGSLLLPVLLILALWPVMDSSLAIDITIFVAVPIIAIAALLMTPFSKMHDQHKKPNKAW